ncbi:MAG TPA: type II secretion system F family protein [Anaerohalosphaeraceae bacterium]|nr:type II secretion system F family protein [Anaerohalosphaeraceae bacterium]HOL31538.1 type II secretion system F family protein [Anaerohalosphaeraceae bacterium]HOM75654.1 type II secretion system F family protein [Anaerohalosphaeraceae bacterium]HPC64430.1 type II secretion system F family protein [Anaerohalosphaeraceae bacterium]HPO68785.1 type II secretion system F family protein [Anaerohalosphaeraceae bacterium]
MPEFIYTATDRSGQVITDTITAPGRRDAIETLFARGLQPAKIEEKTVSETKSVRRQGRVTRSDIETFTRELGNLLASGLSLSKSLKILSRESSKAAARQLWSDIHDNVANGMGLAEALGQRPRYFSSIYVAMVQAGETGGFLELVLGQIADFRSREQELKSRVQAALIYPIILMFLAVLILLFLLIYFIPRFSSIFAEFGGTLPPLTRGIVAVSQAVMHYWFIIAGIIVLAVVTVRSFLQREEGQAAFERWILNTPIIGKLNARFAFVRFARMLGTLLNAGVPLLAALRVAKEAIGYKTLSNTMNNAIEKVRKGVSLSQSLAECPQLFSGANIEMISVAEESSRLGEELLRLAEVNEKELDRNLKTAVSFAEPLMLFAMAALVGTIVIGMLLPIFNLQELIN